MANLLPVVGVILALAATVMSGASLLKTRGYPTSATGGKGVSYLAEFPGRPLASYDLSTPKAATLSAWQMEATGDLRALFELKDAEDGKGLKEQIGTLEIEHEEEWEGTKLLFATYTRDGVRKYKVFRFEKMADTGYWKKCFLDNSLFSVFPDTAEGKRLRHMCDAWEKDGKRSPGKGK